MRPGVPVEDLFNPHGDQGGRNPVARHVHEQAAYP